MKHHYYFMNILLDRLAQPGFFCRVTAVTLRVMAVLIALLSLTIFFKVGKLTFELAPNRVLGGILFEAFFLLAVYAAVHVFVIRARDIEELRPSESYAIATLVVLLKLLGEAYCAFVSLMAIGGGLFVWFTNQGLSNVLGSLVKTLFPGLGESPNFMEGIEFMASGVFIGLAVLITAYAASQALALLIRPARNGGTQQSSPVDFSHGQNFRSRFGS